VIVTHHPLIPTSLLALSPELLWARGDLARHRRGWDIRVIAAGLQRADHSGRV